MRLTYHGPHDAVVIVAAPFGSAPDGQGVELRNADLPEVHDHLKDMPTAVELPDAIAEGLLSDDPAYGGFTRATGRGKAATVKADDGDMLHLLPVYDPRDIAPDPLTPR